MRKKHYILIFFCLSYQLLFSQNLVPNSSFEIYSTCPTGGGQIYYAPPWFNPSSDINNASPDYYHQCSFNMNVPNTPLGFQNAKTGVAFAGIFVFQPQDAREYIETPLTDSLIAGKKYCVEFYVVSGYNNKYAVDAFGLHFSNSVISSNDFFILPYQPQITNSNGNFLSDTLNWMQISGEYIAQGGEKYITIGNFMSNASTNIDSIQPIGSADLYYYIDDVSVYCCDSGAAVLANAGVEKTICKGSGIAIGTTAISGCAYSWQPTAGLTDTTNPQPTVFPQVTTTYYLTITDTTQGSCQIPVKDSVTITVVDFTPVAEAGNNTAICSGDSILIGTTAISGYAYNWQPTIFLSDSTIAQPTAMPTQAITYFLTVQDSGKYCPAAQDSVTVSVIAFPVADAGKDTIFCEGDSIIIGNAAVNGYKYQWQPTTNLSAPTNAQTTATPQQTTQYILSVKDTGNYCLTVQDSVTITVVNLPVANAGGDKIICKGENETIGSPAISGYNYHWQPATGLSDTMAAQPVVSINQLTNQPINFTLTVADTANLCPSDTDSTSISVIDCDTIKENSAFLPSIFSPNGDGANDYFRVRGENIAEGELSIYNRWGERMYDLRFMKDDLKDITKWWDGTYKGKQLNTGVFVYYLKIIFEDGKTEEMKGNVTLAR